MFAYRDAGKCDGPTLVAPSSALIPVKRHLDTENRQNTQKSNSLIEKKILIYHSFIYYFGPHLSERPRIGEEKSSPSPALTTLCFSSES